MCGDETLPDTAIVDSGAFCEANFLRYVIEIFSFGFFYSLNVKVEGAPNAGKLRPLSAFVGPNLFGQWPV